MRFWYVGDTHLLDWVLSMLRSLPLLLLKFLVWLEFNPYVLFVLLISVGLSIKSCGLLVNWLYMFSFSLFVCSINFWRLLILSVFVRDSRYYRSASSYVLLIRSCMLMIYRSRSTIVSSLWWLAFVKFSYSMFMFFISFW